jgi:hypothetical protein
MVPGKNGFNNAGSPTPFPEFRPQPEKPAGIREQEVLAGFCVILAEKMDGCAGHCFQDRDPPESD